ncbi:MAG: protein BatD [Saprospiraceae bacterium]|nr:protein BatD [Saprospiraceae bacterium]
MRLRLFFLFFLFAFYTLSGQSIRINAPKSVQVGEAFQIAVEVDGADLDQLQLPDFTGFEVVGGPMRSSSVSIINGQMSKTSSLGYELMATKAGNFTIGSASVMIKGQKLTSKPITITVGGQSMSDPAVANADVFIRLEVSPKQNAYYVGQQIMVKYVVYYNQNIQFDDYLEEPAFEHFFVQPVDMKDNERSTVQINGKVFSKAVMSAKALFPQKEGAWNVGKLKGKFSIEDGVSGSGFFATRRYKPLVLESNELEIVVKQLPANPPASFSGAVGDYSFSAAADKQSLATNESLKLNIEIEGNGDHKLIQGPKLSLGKDLEVYDPNKIDEQIDYDQEYQYHKSVFQYFIVASNAGSYSIAPEFSYFDPVDGQYVTLTADSLRFDVVNARNTFQGADQDTPETPTQGLPSWAYGLMGAGLFGLIGGLIYLLWSRISQKAQHQPADLSRKNDKRIMPKSRPNKVPDTEIPDVSANNFYKKINDFIHNAIMTKLNDRDIPNTTPGIVDAIQQQKGEELGRQARFILIKCEEKRFFDNGNLEEREEIIKNTKDLLERL